MNLSPNFTLAELTITQQRGLDNTPSEVVLARLRTLAEHLEKVKAILGGVPILVNSAYRSPAVNKAVGSKPTSAHIQGWAADFIAPRFGTPFQVATALARDLKAFDQLIYEGTWIHLSIDPRFRGQVLTMRGGKYLPGLQEKV